MIDKDIFFTVENTGFYEFKKLVLQLASYLIQNNIKQTALYLNNTFDFCVALFGCMHAKCECFILPTPINEDKNVFFINDFNFKKCFAKSLHSDINYALDTVFYIKTSGSSGKRKNIAKTFEQMFKEAEFLRDFLSLHKGVQIFSSVSHQHMFGLTFKVFLSFVSGSKLYSTELNYPEALFAKDDLSGIFITSPAVIEKICENPNRNFAQKIKFVVTAGSKLRDDLRAEFEKISSAKVMEIYGSSETGVIAQNFGNDFEIFDKVDLKNDKFKRLIVNSPWCNNFLSNDLGEIDHNKLVLKGRFDRIIKLNDKRINLEDAQNTILKHKYIKECRCELRPNDNRISALVVLSDEGKEVFRSGGRKAVFKNVREFLRPFFKNDIRHFKITSALCKNQQGKFVKSSFEKAFNELKKPVFIKIKDGHYEAFMQEDLFFFDGHFAEFPLVPGFVQLGFVWQIAKQNGYDLTKFNLFENIKFKNFLRPFDIARIYIEFQKDRLNFKIYANDKICASGRIRSV